MVHIKKINEMKINESLMGDDERKVVDIANRRGVEHFAYTILWLITQQDYTLPKKLIKGILKYKDSEFTINDRIRVFNCV